MRNVVRVIGLALLVALASAYPLTAQTPRDRVTLNALLGPSFANVGTTLAAAGALDVRLDDRLTIVGEVGVLPHASFDDAASIAPPSLFPSGGRRVNAYHWNGNVKVRAFERGRFQPYVTGGAGLFTTDAVAATNVLGASTVRDRRSVTDFATNVGAGLLYRLNDWAGLSAEYRTFFVHRDEDTPRVNRLTTGLTFSLK